VSRSGKAAEWPLRVLVVCKRIGWPAAAVANHCRRQMFSVGSSHDGQSGMRRGFWTLSDVQAVRMAAIRLGLPTMFITRVRLSTDAFLDLRHPPRHLGMREVAVAVIHRLELAAVDCDAWGLQQAHLPA